MALSFLLRHRQRPCPAPVSPPPIPVHRLSRGCLGGAATGARPRPRASERPFPLGARQWRCPGPAAALFMCVTGTVPTVGWYTLRLCTLALSCAFPHPHAHPRLYPLSESSEALSVTLKGRGAGLGTGGRSGRSPQAVLAVHAPCAQLACVMACACLCMGVGAQPQPRLLHLRFRWPPQHRAVPLRPRPLVHGSKAAWCVGVSRG